MWSNSLALGGGKNKERRGRSVSRGGRGRSRHKSGGQQETPDGGQETPDGGSDTEVSSLALGGGKNKERRGRSASRGGRGGRSGSQQKTIDGGSDTDVASQTMDVAAGVEVIEEGSDAAVAASKEMYIDIEASGVTIEDGPSTDTVLHAMGLRREKGS